MFMRCLIINPFDRTCQSCKNNLNNFNLIHYLLNVSLYEHHNLALNDDRRSKDIAYHKKLVKEQYENF